MHCQLFSDVVAKMVLFLPMIFYPTSQKDQGEVSTGAAQAVEEAMPILH